MNRKRIVVGGVAAGLVLLVVEGLATTVFLMDRYRSLGQAGVYYERPRLPFYPVWVLLALGIGLGLAWLYASVRPRLGPGPGTAALLGLVVGLMIYTPGNVATFAWTHEGGFVALVRLVAGSIGSVIATLVAGAIYREESPAPAPGP
jgi:hypothetical protein